MWEAQKTTALYFKKPKLLLKDKFPFTQSLNIGDKGNISTTLKVARERLEMLEDDNEHLFLLVEVINAEPVK